MTRNLHSLTALGLLLIVGVWHGVWSERWLRSSAVDDAAAKLQLVPLELGDWQGKDVEVEAEAFARAGARGYWARSYTHRHGDGTVLAILMCGRAGRMAVHTPEVCYRGAGYDLFGAPEPAAVQSGDSGNDHASFLSARFSKRTGAASDLRLYWAWGDGASWEAPANPRWHFRGRTFLYKLYVSQDAWGPRDADLTTEFLQQVLPELRKVLE